MYPSLSGGLVGTFPFQGLFEFYSQESKMAKVKS